MGALASTPKRPPTDEQVEREVTFRIVVEPEDIPVRGNAVASGDDDFDRTVEDEIIARVEQGDEWAWCCVRVVATWRGFTGDDTLGGCSYDGEESFKASGYFDDMKARAVDELRASIVDARKKIARLDE